MTRLFHSPGLLFLFINLIIVSPGLFAQVPSISSFAPLSGPVGTSVTITGNNFSTTPANNIVRLGAVKAKVTNSTNTTITITVPTGATYTPLSVTVNNLTASSTQPFITTFPSCSMPFSPNAFSQVNLNTPVSYRIDASLADFDDDGKPEVFMQTVILRNVSNSGTFAFDSAYYAFPGNSVSEVGIADIDGDGKLDFAVGDDTLMNQQWGIYAPILRIYLNTSTGPGNITFARFSFLDIPGSLLNLHLNDMDGDGKPDLVIPGGLHSSTTYILRNTSIAPGTVSFAPPIEITVPYATQLVTIGDIDGDGKQDMLISGYSPDSFCVYRNTSSGIGNISLATAIGYHATGGAGRLVIGDLNGDGKNDIVFPSQGNRIGIFQNTGMAGLISLSPATGLQLLPGSLISSLCIADLDGDGKPDLVTGVRDNNNNFNNFNNISVFKNTSTVDSISFTQNIDYSKNLYALSLAVGDLDGDGKPDLTVITLGQPNSFALFQNNVCSVVDTVLLTELKAVYLNNAAHVTWNTRRERNTGSFQIERSIDSVNFSSIGNVKAAGNSNAEISYEFDDTNANLGNNYYRLNIIDINGNSTYSNVVFLRVNINGTNITSTYPNPFNDKVNVVISSEKTEPVTIRIAELTGRSLFVKRYTVNPGSTMLSITGLGGLPKGLYLMQIYYGTATTTEKLLKQ